MGNFSTLIAHADRSFANLYDVEIKVSDPQSNQILSSLNLDKIGFLAEDVNFGDGFSLETFYSEPTKENFIIGASRAKTISISFRETRDFKVATTFRTWQKAIYSQEKNAFISGNPTGQILIKLDPDNYTGAGELNSIRTLGAIPTKVGVPTMSWKDGNPLLCKVDFSISDIDFFVENSYASSLVGNT